MTSSNFRLLAIAGIAGIVLSMGARAQSPAFEVASIRRNLNGGEDTQINTSGGRLTVTNSSVKTLIRNAYDILSFQLAGGPRWLDADMYDIVATTGSAETIPQTRLRLLFQNLLADRFGLKVHWETREASVYALTIDKGGPKFQVSSGSERPGVNTSKRAGRGQMKGTREPISILASNLGNQLGAIVLDNTDLAGRYDWTLVWGLDPNIESTEPSLFTALKEQLGLRLNAQKGPMEVLVIDSVSKPSEN
jgi:uncharacterized protein (TIGR03435 family)